MVGGKTYHAGWTSSNSSGSKGKVSRGEGSGGGSGIEVGWY